MKEEWINLLDENPPSASIPVLIEVPCYFDCDSDGKYFTAWVQGKYVVGKDDGFIYPFPINLANKGRKWKWKLNENDKNHWEDIYAWATKRQNLFVPDNYHYYRKRKNNDFRTFGKERPMNGTSIILQFETEGQIFQDDEGYLLMQEGPLFMCSEMSAPIRIYINQENFVVKWKY